MNRGLAFDKVRRYLLLTFVMALALVGACTSSGGESVIGEVMDLEARSITEFVSLSVIDEDGKVWEFTGGRFVGFTPSHLREHQALGDPIKVWYVDENGELRVTRIGDAS